MSSPTKAVSMLIKTLKGGKSIPMQLKIAAAQGLGFAGGAEARIALMDALTDRSSVDIEVQVAAAIALGHASREF